MSDRNGPTAAFVSSPEINSASAVLAGRMLNAPVFETTNQPVDTLTLGRFSDLLIGQFGCIDIVVDEYTNASTGVVNIYAYMWADVAVRHPESFCTITGI